MNIFYHFPPPSATYRDQVCQLVQLSPRYDPRLPPGVDSRNWPKANGFRSFVSIAASIVDIVAAKLMTIEANRAKGGAMTDRDEKEMNTVIQMLDRLVSINTFLLDLHAMTQAEEGDSRRRTRQEGEEEQEEDDPLPLFPINEDGHLNDHDGIRELSTRIGLLDYSAFYGRACGFHYNRTDFSKVARPFVLLMAGYASMFQKKEAEEEKTGWWVRFSRAIRGIWGLRRILLDPEHTAQKVAQAAKENPVEFCQGFFNLSETDLFHPQSLRYRVGNSPWGKQKIKCNQLIRIPAERMSIENNQGRRNKDIIKFRWLLMATV